nr:MAG TPA: hypothetical protein [Caudoviricetes sp.]
MADFNITDRYAQQIKNVTYTEGLGNQFPLLSRIPKSGADLLQTVELQGLPVAKLEGEPNDTLEIDDQTYNTLTVNGFGFGISLNDAGNLTADGIQNALTIVRDTLYETIEAHLIWGRVHSSMAKSPIRGALVKANTQDKFSQSGDDILFVKENDFQPVVSGITKIETLSFKQYDNEGQNEFEKILINPYKGILLGDLNPEFKVTKNIRGNKVEVYGTVSVAGGFFNAGSVKVYPVQGG